MNVRFSSHRRASRQARALALATLALGASSFALAQTNGTWTSTTGGNWSNIANWSSGVIADGTGAVATLSATGTQTVNLDVNATLGSIAFSNGTYTISSSNGSVLTLATSTGTPTFTSSGTINAVIAGTQGLTMSGGNRTLTLGGANTYTGVTTLTNGNLTIRSNDGFGATGSGNGTVVSQSSGQYPQLHFANNVTTSEDITLNMNWYSVTAGATVGGNLLYNDSGTTTLNGTLTLNRSASTNSGIIHVLGIQAGAGTLNINGAVSGAATGGQASGAYTDQTRLQFRTTATSANINVAGVISNGTLTTGGLSVYTTDNSAGIVRLSGANTYTGSTVHQKGSLLVNNATGSGTGVGAVSVANTATFGGFGIVAPTGANGVTFASGSIVAPGDLTSAGAAKAEGKTLTFDLSGTTGKVTFETGSIIALDLTVSPTATVEKFSFLGLGEGVADVVFNSNVVNFSITGGVLADGLYTLATFDAANAYSGQWVIGSGLDDYAIKSLVYGANSIQLQIGAIPEPSSAAALAGLAALGLGATRRRRARR